MDVYNNFHSILLGFQKVDVYLISEKSKEHDFLGFFFIFRLWWFASSFQQQNRTEKSLHLWRWLEGNAGFAELGRLVHRNPAP